MKRNMKPKKNPNYMIVLTFLFYERIKFCLIIFFSLFRKVRWELQSQIDRFQSLMGQKPEHIDGHQHAHLLPGKPIYFTEQIPCILLNDQ